MIWIFIASCDLTISSLKGNDGDNKTIETRKIKKGSSSGRFTNAKPKDERGRMVRCIFLVKKMASIIFLINSFVPS